ncbi:hypothetical protein RW092_10440 [Paenibacillus sp. 3LSP]|uniref:hypothetical protein n=1 Tax=Paenibacillus sp. 3LSP TaxID=2800795 RepID=UPI0028FD2FEA|nr:hypothetical protein [Paenibacillus sp. 3LSP]MDU0330615.1 hypothetical protein [Paenibacillus sp. 3LSP]
MDEVEPHLPERDNYVDEPCLVERDNTWMEWNRICPSGWNRLIERDHVWRKLNRNSKNGMKGGDMGPLLIAWDRHGKEER